MINDEIKKKEEEEEMKRQQHLQIQKFLREEEKERKRTMASLKSHQRESKSRIFKVTSIKTKNVGCIFEMLVTVLFILVPNIVGDQNLNSITNIKKCHQTRVVNIWRSPKSMKLQTILISY